MSRMVLCAWLYCANAHGKLLSYYNAKRRLHNVFVLAEARE